MPILVKFVKSTQIRHISCLVRKKITEKKDLLFADYLIDYE
ncbi:hypothetical protein NBRC111894_2880 [Sporolactobacillus inulinus]|uniref:Uncharacterized protein n=1 Tax=Sporolactobacillus inulinus TaxID=2078 RepID=A0A4Y1ZDX0_9BACL|nr:hypothetical protein NBRC111894_2880 [Sporolactobacillus inulinus]